MISQEYSNGSRRGLTAVCTSILSAALTLLATGPAAAIPDPIDVHARVFHDIDANGSFDVGEPVLSGIRITNGEQIFLTDVDGELDLVVDRAVYRFATLTIPAGWWPTTPWYAWVPVGLAGPVSVDFGLRQRPETASDPIKWIHVADTQVADYGDPWKFQFDLEEINEFPWDPLMIINTGDLVEVGSDTTHWNNYMQQMSVSDFDIFPVVGNHDTTGTATPLNNYEQYVGPPYYSFEMGSYHFLVYNDEAPEIGTPNQDAWLDLDVAAAPPGSRLLVFQHRLVKEIPVSVGDHWASLGVQAVFSGHWHANQITRQKNGIVDYNIGRTRTGAVDHTSRALGIVTCNANGTIDYEIRRLGINHRAEISHPVPGEIIFGNTLDAMFQVYDSSSPVTSLSVTVNGTGGSVGPLPLLREGPVMWRLPVPLGALPSGSYTMTVAGSFQDGTTINKAAAFTRSVSLPPSPSTGDDWPMFRREPKGTSFSPTSLKPPLTLAWVRQIPGFVELSSPVVAGGKVYLGARAEGDPGTAGVSAFDADSGTPLWFRPLTGGTALAPAVAGNVVLANTMSDSCYGLDATTGNILWARYKPSSRFDISAPIIDGTKVWMGTEPRTNRINWVSGVVDFVSGNIGNDWFPYIYSAPAVGTSNIYFGSFGGPGEGYGGFTVVNRNTGAVSLKVDGAFRSPIWADSAVYVVGDPNRNNQKLSLRDPSGGVLWTASKTLGGGTGSPALGRGVLVVPGAEGKVEAFQASDGAALWTKTVGNVLWDVSNGIRGGKATNAAPCIADSVVYIGSGDGKLYALDLFSGVELWNWNFKVPVVSSACVSGNMLFVGASDNHLYAFTNAPPQDPTGVGTSPASGAIHFAAPRPNPFVEGVQLSFALPRSTRVDISVFDVRGRLVRRIAARDFDAGQHTIAWDGSDETRRVAGQGVYFVRFEADGVVQTRKVVRLGKTDRR